MHLKISLLPALHDICLPVSVNACFPGGEEQSQTNLEAIPNFRGREKKKINLFTGDQTFSESFSTALTCQILQ